MNSNKIKKVPCFSSLYWLKTFWCLAFAVSLFFMAIYFQWYLTARQWHKADDLFVKRKYQEAEIIYSNIYSKLKWNCRFLTYFGNVKLQIKKYFDAIKLYEKSKSIYCSPYLFENLGSAYINYQFTITNEIPQPLFEKRELTRGKCVNKAINYWIMASNIQPWRLTPKYYLANLFYQIGDTNSAAKYARLVVNTPMKKWTERGKDFKLKSQKILIALGEKCDDPGLVVFDINDKNTWNEGRW